MGNRFLFSSCLLLWLLGLWGRGAGPGAPSGVHAALVPARGRLAWGLPLARTGDDRDALNRTPRFRRFVAPAMPQRQQPPFAHFQLLGRAPLDTRNDRTDQPTRLAFASHEAVAELEAHGIEPLVAIARTQPPIVWPRPSTRPIRAFGVQRRRC